MIGAQLTSIRCDILIDGLILIEIPNGVFNGGAQRWIRMMQKYLYRQAQFQRVDFHFMGGGVHWARDIKNAAQPRLETAQHPIQYDAADNMMQPIIVSKAKPLKASPSLCVTPSLILYRLCLMSAAMYPLYAQNMFRRLPT